MRHPEVSIVHLVILALVVLAPTMPAVAQVTLDSSVIQTTTSASTPSCLDNGTGGPGIPMGTASCSGPPGYTAAASATANFALTSTGASLSSSAQTGATAPGTFPVQNSNGNGSGFTAGNWTAAGATHYSVSCSGDATPNISGLGGALPPSGVLMASDPFSLSLNASSFAFAQDNGALSAADASSGDCEVTFAPVGASDLIMGTVLAGGLPMAGLLVEALDGGIPIASTLTASDGSYLLAGIPMPVILRLSDPGGQFVTELSPLQTPPATYDADLEPIPPVPGLGAPGGAALVAGLGALGLAGLRGRRA